VRQKGYLVLENGAVFEGLMLGSLAETGGEVVFNTAMVGYEQVMSDPSYAGQIVVMTYPLIGNYGINPAHMESEVMWLRGLVVRELCLEPEHYQSQMSLDQFLADKGLVCLTDVDTRALTRVLRTRGTMGGVIVPSLDDMHTLKEKARRAAKPPHGGHVLKVTSRQVRREGNGPKRVVLMDFGVKKSIISALVKRGCEVITVPADTDGGKIMEFAPHGLVLSNGPGDPRDCMYAVETVKSMLEKVPILGICLGHQLLALALGAETYKMRFGHRGGNHPVKDLHTGKVHITSQNHGYAVDEASLSRVGAYVSFRNLNDGTVEGLRHDELPVLSVQFHPEAAPGPQDTEYLFDSFLKLM